MQHHRQPHISLPIIAAGHRRCGTVEDALCGDVVSKRKTFSIERYRCSRRERALCIKVLEKNTTSPHCEISTETQGFYLGVFTVPVCGVPCGDGRCNTTSPHTGTVMPAAPAAHSRPASFPCRSPHRWPPQIARPGWSARIFTPASHNGPELGWGSTGWGRWAAGPHGRGHPRSAQQTCLSRLSISTSAATTAPPRRLAAQRPTPGPPPPPLQPHTAEDPGSNRYRGLVTYVPRQSPPSAVRLTIPATRRAAAALIGGAASASRCAQARMWSSSSLLSWFATGCSQRDRTPQRARVSVRHPIRADTRPCLLRSRACRSLSAAVASLTLR